MLKQNTAYPKRNDLYQPPSGGCVLKRSLNDGILIGTGPAAFRRLCVETALYFFGSCKMPPAAFRRLCVET